MQEGKGLFRLSAPAVEETDIPGSQHDQVRRQRLCLSPDPAHLAQEDVHRHPADALCQCGEPLLQVPGVRCFRMEPDEIALIALPERSTKVEQLGGGLEVVPHVAAAVQDRHQTVPSSPLDRFRRRDACLLKGLDRVFHDGLGDSGAEEDRSEEPSEDIA